MSSLGDAFSEGSDPEGLKRRIEQQKEQERERARQEAEREKQRQEAIKEQERLLQEKQLIAKFSPIVTLVERLNGLPLDNGSQYGGYKIVRLTKHPDLKSVIIPCIENDKMSLKLALYIEAKGEVERTIHISGIPGYTKDHETTFLGALAGGNFFEAAFHAWDLATEPPEEKKLHNQIIQAVTNKDMSSFNLSVSSFSGFGSISPIPDTLPEGTLAGVTMREAISKIIRAVGMVAPSKKQQIMPIIQEVEAELVRWESEHPYPEAHPQ